MPQFYTFIVILGLCQTVQAVIWLGCKNCGCCVDKLCSTSSRGLRHYCNKGCIDGIYGDRCYTQCPSECAACERNGRHIMGMWTHDCTKCPDGKYLSNYIKDCSLSCPTTCKTCTSDTVCTECKAPYFNYGAVTNCSLYCPGNCECSESGTCLACKEGFFSPQSQCSSNCPSNCQSCSSFQNCDKCRTGLYNGIEFDSPNGTYFKDCRYSCRASCVDCLSYNLCYSCVPGTYSIHCEQTCSIGCKYGRCDKSNGSCECKKGFTGQQCNACVNGKYGKRCDKECSTLCKNSICEKSGGQCVECVTDYFTDRYCSRCISGRYGSNCTLECPKNCNNSICERYSGDCSQGCNENFVGDKCDACVSGKYGANCSLDCPRNCQDNGCARETGFCFGCKGNFKGDKCDKCTNGFYKDECSEVCKSNRCFENVCHREFGNCTSCPNGYYGELCDKICSNGCFDRTCDIETGACSDGCLPHFSGDKCCVRTSGCEICESNSECIQCRSGYYGNDCEMECPLTCNGNCDKESGICETCPPDMYGLFCNYSCPISCNYESGQRVCNASTGNCLLGCQNGYHGHTCEDKCGHNCVENKCHRITGYCQSGCAEGFQGNVCSEEIVAVNIAGTFTGGVLGVVVLVTGIIVGICFFRRRKMKVSECNTNNNMDAAESVFNGESAGPNDVAFTELQEEDNVVDEDTEDTALDDTYYNMTTKIKVSNLFNYVRNKTRESFKAEFRQLPKNLMKPCTFARRQENISKNRYNGMYPYDHSRVQINGDPTFFINACYIDGFQKEKEYISSLGPTKKTTDNFNTFWKMVWHEKSDVIVMLTNLTEPTGMKCEKYWPDLGEAIQYDDVTAVCEKEEVFVEYTVRTFTLSKDKQERTLTQFHYTAWPDKDVPDNVTSLIEFWQSKDVAEENGGTHNSSLQCRRWENRRIYCTGQTCKGRRRYWFGRCVRLCDVHEGTNSKYGTNAGTIYLSAQIFVSLASIRLSSGTS